MKYQSIIEFLESADFRLFYASLSKERRKWYRQAFETVGSLGQGNHFCELQKDTDGYLWFMIHSGSRNLGKKVADHYNDAAKLMNKKWFSEVPLSWDLSFLPMDSEEGKNYIKEMKYCVEFAFANRKEMMLQVKQAIINTLGSVNFDEMINIAHNYAAMESHFGNNVMVHRKGATRARVGEIGIIPGSQGSKSYIVEGLGNEESFMSCSHGAGRKMSRSQAKKVLDVKTEASRLNQMGIIHSIRDINDLDEAPSAYKDIDVVMNEQKDLVKIKVELTPLGVIKG